MTTESLVRDRFALSGLVVAGLGFFLTRFTVTLAAYDDPTSFVIAGIVPLVLGLALAAFGVALVVGEFERSFVRTVTLWCLAGTTAMFLLVVLTLLGSTGPGGFMSARSQAYLSNFLIGGSVGGALTGVYAANTERQRYELRQEANRSVMVNRLLRDEVLNALTVIRGRVEVARGNEGEPRTRRSTPSTGGRATCERPSRTSNTSRGAVGRATGSKPSPSCPVSSRRSSPSGGSSPTHGTSSRPTRRPT
ncbi:hypothetical protein ACFQH8_02330 [Halomicroarcula sp. GCM10025710]